MQALPRKVILTLLVFGIIYSAIAFVNHYLFRTYALDLGLYTNALYDYVHLRWNDSSTFKEIEQNLLADHFDLYLILFSPLSLLLGTYTLQFIQIIALITGALGIYEYGKLKFQHPSFAWAAMLSFLLFFGSFSAVAFDYHSNVVAACILPWFFWALEKNKIKLSITLFLIILGAKENMAIWLFFVCTGAAWLHRSNSNLRKMLLILSVFCPIYFYVITQIIMPSLSQTGGFEQLKYSVLGKNIKEIVTFLLIHPFDAAKLLFINPSTNVLADYVKTEFHLFALISGVWLLFFRPVYIWMLIPIYLQKMYHDNYIIWGISAQYSIEFAPILAIGTFAVIDQFSSIKTKNILAVIHLILILGVTVRSMDKTVLFTDKSRIRFYQSSHYKRDYDIKKVHEALQLIPHDAVVSAQSPFVPHLALRDKIYQFPIIKDAEFILFSKNELGYPLQQIEFEKLCDSLLTSPNFKTIYSGEVTILERKL